MISTNKTQHTQEDVGHAHCFKDSMNAKLDTMVEPYKVIGDNMISVCANCYPGDSILKLFPDLDGVGISHGVCPRHAALYRLEILKLKLKSSNSSN